MKLVTRQYSVIYHRVTDSETLPICASIVQYGSHLEETPQMVVLGLSTFGLQVEFLH